MFTSDTSSLFIFLLGVVGITGEWRHRTITSSLLAAPDRLRFLAAKTLAFAAAGWCCRCLTVTIMAVGHAHPVGAATAHPRLGELAGVLWRNAVVAALLGAFGVCIGGLLRNQSSRSSVCCPRLRDRAGGAGSGGERRALRPDGGSAQRHPGNRSLRGGQPVSPGFAVLVMLAWVGVGFAATAVILRRRDLV